MAKVRRSVTTERNLRAWDLAQQGLTHERIAFEMNLERSTITKMLGRIAQKAQLNMLTQATEQKVMQISRLNYIVDEAMQAWARSKESAKIIQQRKGGGTGEASGAASQTVTSTQIRDQDGDPRYLETAMKAMAEVRKIMGIDAPAKNLNVDTAKLSDEQLDRIIAGEDVLHVLLSGGNES